MKKYRVLCIVAIVVLLLCVIAGRQTEATGIASQQITIVEVPQNLNFYLDPENQDGRGQIYSNKYRIRNAGKEPITFSIEMTLAILEKQTVIAFCPEEWSMDPEDRSIYMYAVFEGSWGEDRCVLTDSQIPCSKSIVLKPAGMDGDTAYISFGGALSRSKEWKSGELGINAVYSMSADSMKYQLLIDGSHIRIKDDVEKLAAGEMTELYLVPDEGYSLPAEIQVYMGETEIEASYDMAAGKIVLENVSGDIVICADGITKAALPDAEVMDMEETVWSWTVEDGIQAYEYTFLQGDEVIDNGRFDVDQERVNWNWSEKLEDGSYELRLKAIGDAIHCLNSEERSYPITVERALLESPERTETEVYETEQISDNGL